MCITDILLISVLLNHIKFLFLFFKNVCTFDLSPPSVDSEHRSLIKQENAGMQNQISDLRLDVSRLHSASERLSRRMDAQESQNRKVPHPCAHSFLFTLTVCIPPSCRTVDFDWLEGSD